MSINKKNISIFELQEAVITLQERVESLEKIKSLVKTDEEALSCFGLTVKQFHDATKIGINTIYRKIKTGEIQTVKARNILYIPHEEMQRIMINGL